MEKKTAITLEAFFTACNDRTLHTRPVLLFSGKEYPVLFFSALLHRLRVSYQPVPKNVSYHTGSFSPLLAQLSTTFLGQRDFLWLGDISSLEDAATKKQLLALLPSYQGPHALIGYVHQDDLPARMPFVISLNDEPLSASAQRMAVTFLFPHVAHEVLEDLLKTVRTTSLDHLVLLANYAGVVGKNIRPFKQEWLTTIIAPEASLFTLSQYFFARKTELFWPLWNSLKEQYAAPFWTTYWSEQLWRAYYVIKLYKEQKITEAKQLSYRLPFSFLQRDWKNLSADELQKAHHFLYKGDYSFKNGGSEFFLEVFYATFLAKQF